MKVEKIEISESVLVDFVDDDSRRRYSADCWTWLIGESEEHIYDCKELESAYQEYISNNRTVLDVKQGNNYAILRAEKILKNKGYGKGTNFTTSLVTSLMVEAQKDLLPIFQYLGDFLESLRIDYIAGSTKNENVIDWDQRIIEIEQILDEINYKPKH